MLRMLFVPVLLVLSACQPPSVKVTDLESFDNQAKRDSLIHGNLKVLPPTEASNAKITMDAHSVTLTKSHVLGIKSELYQPSFRLEGIIAPLTQTDVSLPETASLKSLYVKIGDTVDVGDRLALFYHNTWVDDSLATTNNISNTLEMSDVNDGKDSIKNNQTTSAITQTAITITAPKKGRIQAIYPQNKEQTYTKGSLLLTIGDESQLKFISLLPNAFKEHLNVGGVVSFSTADAKTFSGQIEKITQDPLIKNTLNVHVVISPQEIQKAKLTLGESVNGYVDYGQKTVGVLVPAFAILDEALQPMDLNTLRHPPFKPATPINAQIWTIKQDERLHLTPIQIIEYHPQSDHYLINGISLTGLVVLANLPKTAQGKRVRLK